MAKREILFRGWNKKNKQWLYGYYCVNRGEHFIAPDEFVNPLASYEDYVVDADSVGQYTGLKDAKGKRIFEGDIIEGYGFQHIIQYDENMACFTGKCTDLQEYVGGIDQRWIDEFKKVVIGNVHEDQELNKTE